MGRKKDHDNDDEDQSVLSREIHELQALLQAEKLRLDRFDFGTIEGFDENNNNYNNNKRDQKQKTDKQKQAPKRTKSSSSTSKKGSSKLAKGKESQNKRSSAKDGSRGIVSSSDDDSSNVAAAAAAERSAALEEQRQNHQKRVELVQKLEDLTKQLDAAEASKDLKKGKDSKNGGVDSAKKQIKLLEMELMRLSTVGQQLMEATRQGRERRRQQLKLQEKQEAEKARRQKQEIVVEEEIFIEDPPLTATKDNTKNQSPHPDPEGEYRASRRRDPEGVYYNDRDDDDDLNKKKQHPVKSVDGGTLDGEDDVSDLRSNDDGKSVGGEGGWCYGYCCAWVPDSWARVTSRCLGLKKKKQESNEEK